MAALQKRVPLPLAVKSGTAEGEALWTNENLVNLYAEAASGQALSPVKLRSVPGFELFGDIGGGVERGFLACGSFNLAILGQTLYRAEAGSSVYAPISGTIDGTQRCDMDRNRTQIVIVADNRSYYYTPATNTAAEILDTDLHRASSVAVVDDYAIFTEAGSDEAQIADLADVSSVDALNFVTAEFSVDELVAVRRANGAAVMFGRESIEHFVNTNGGDNIFERSSSAIPIDVGCYCRDAIAVTDNSYFWLGTSNKSDGIVVYRADNYSPVRISNHMVESWLERAPNPQDAHAIAYTERGHLHYGLTIPGYGSRFYDVATKEWHQRVAGQWPMRTPGPPQGDWGCSLYAASGGNRLVLRNGNVYRLSERLHTQDGAGICREATLPPFFLGGRPFVIDEIEFIVQTGVGLDDGTDADEPKLLLSLSTDGGKTFSEPRDRPLGRIGQTDLSVIFGNCGWCEGPKGLIPRVRCVDPVELNIVGAFITYRVG